VQKDHRWHSTPKIGRFIVTVAHEDDEGTRLRTVPSRDARTSQQIKSASDCAKRSPRALRSGRSGLLV